MNPEHIVGLLEIVKAKQQSDKNYSWSNDSNTYLDEIKSEVGEVEEEIETGRTCFLEDELGDVLWDYLNLLQSLENENQIKLERVFERSFQKYTERWAAIQSGSTWSEIKTAQKRKLEIEHESRRQ